MPKLACSAFLIVCLCTCARALPLLCFLRRYSRPNVQGFHSWRAEREALIRRALGGAKELALLPELLDSASQGAL